MIINTLTNEATPGPPNLDAGVVLSAMRHTVTEFAALQSFLFRFDLDESGLLTRFENAVTEVELALVKAIIASIEELLNELARVY